MSQNPEQRFSHYPLVYATGKLPNTGISFVSENIIDVEEFETPTFEITKLPRVRDTSIFRITRLSEKGRLSINDWLFCHTSAPIVLYRYVFCYGVLKIHHGSYKVEIPNFDEQDDHPLFKIGAAINYDCGNDLITFISGKSVIGGDNLVRLRKEREDLTDYYERCIDEGIITLDEKETPFPFSPLADNVSRPFLDNYGTGFATSLWVENESGESIPVSASYNLPFVLRGM